MTRRREKISWVLADSVEIDPMQDLAQLKKVGAFWGSWRTWRSCQTDNVICHDQVKAAELVQRGFQDLCNFYIPDSVHASLQRPQGILVYGGDFVHDTVRQEEIVAMHLAASTSDIVIMLGWRLSRLETNSDKLTANQQQHHRNLIKQAFVTYDQIQWVIVDHTEPVDPGLLALENVVTDNLSTVLTLV